MRLRPRREPRRTGRGGIGRRHSDRERLGASGYLNRHDPLALLPALRGPARDRRRLRRRCGDGRVHLRRTAPAVAMAVVEAGTPAPRAPQVRADGRSLGPAGGIHRGARGAGGHRAPRGRRGDGLAHPPARACWARSPAAAPTRASCCSSIAAWSRAEPCAPGTTPARPASSPWSRRPRPFAYGPHRQVLALLRAEWEGGADPGTSSDGAPGRPDDVKSLCSSWLWIGMPGPGASWRSPLEPRITVAVRNRRP